MSLLDFVIALLCVSAAHAAVMTAAWWAWRTTGNSGWVDTVWTFGLGTVGIVSALAPSAWSGHLSARALIVALLVAIWSARLGLHIAGRTKGIKDDPRYAKLIEGWGSDARRQMFWLLQKQALVSIPLATSIFLAAWNPAPGLRVQDFVGALVLAAAIAGEALADHQLRSFRSDPANKGRICDVGLWGWSRHPNYFFEWFGWIAYPIIAIDLSGGYPWGWIALAGPACMYWLLVYVSGIPPLEQHMLEKRGQAFRDYQARTHAFFPAPPRTLDERTR
jgi:steroid 5-alpha reductase family enzyme